jgi:8-oxo-dGTP pyrophosphatase MutT (NUDIX family)
MALLDRIAELNAHDLSNYLPFFAGAAQVGWIASKALPVLSPYGEVLELRDDRVALAAGLADPPARTRAMDEVARDLRERGAIGGWRDESYPVVPLWDRELSTPPLFAIERAAVPFFGIRAFGIHVNGFVRQGGRCALWIARRSASAHVHPGKLDNMVAGGQPADLSPFDNMVKEAAEEADVDADVSARARPAGFISYCVETPEGLSTATMFVFDLELAPDFVPRNTDGELTGFECLPVDEVLWLVAETHEFKPNSNLVIIDFLIRHGVLGPGRSDYAALVKGLRS